MGRVGSELMPDNRVANGGIAIPLILLSFSLACCLNFSAERVQTKAQTKIQKTAALRRDIKAIAKGVKAG